MDLVQRFELAHKLEGHSGCVNAIHFNETGNRLASGSDDLDIYVWDWQKGKKQLSFKSGHTANVFQSKFLPLSGDTLIATTSRDGQVRLAEVRVSIEPKHDNVVYTCVLKKYLFNHFDK